MDIQKNIVLSQERVSIVRTIHELDKILYKNITQSFEKLNISHIQALVIIYLSTYTDRENYQIDLEKEFGLTNPTMTASIKSMIQKDLVSKVKSKKDGRYYILTLTPKGSSLYQDCYDIYNNLEIKIDEYLTIEEKAKLKSIANKILVSIK